MEDILKALANEKRLKIIYALSLGDMCQTHIEELTNISQVDLSRNCATLVKNNIIVANKKQNRVIYSLDKDFIRYYDSILKQIIKNYNYLSNNINEEDLLQRCKTYTGGNTDAI